nr:retrotransposon protein, putative, unclassified [Tanacetum cinerariifolium]
MPHGPDFITVVCDSSLFIYRHGSQVAYLLLYVDDIILTASSTTLLQQIIDYLHKEFYMTDLRVLNYFLGISVVHHSTGLFLSQKKYALDILSHAHMVNCNPSRTRVDSETKLGPDGVPVSTFGYCMFLGGNLLLWFAKRQHTISRFSAEAEYQGVSNIVLETAWLHNLLCELHSRIFTATMVYCDNVSAVYMSANPV